MDLNILMSAKTFAVVGASADPNKVGHQILSNLHANLDLIVYPINLKGGTILGLPVYPHLSETPLPAEIVLISVPIFAVEPLIDECIKIQAKAVVLITSGFAEVGRTGADIQARIVTKLHQAGIALLGPNTMGYYNTSRQITASFGPNNVSAGPIALISQSGAMLSALFSEYASANTGISFALSLGNRTGINENDALTYALDDPNTRLVVIYLESLANPRDFLNICKHLTRIKPIFLLKGGTTAEGRLAAASHTAALATSEILLSELCEQAGIVQVANFEQLVRASISAAKTAFLPQNLMIITNAGGPAVILADELAEVAVPLSSTPLDLLGDATSKDYADALNKYSNDLTIDAIAAIVTEQAVTNMPEIVNVLKRKRGKHLLYVCIAGGDKLDIYRKDLKAAGIIVTRYPNEIAETIASLSKAQKNIGRKIPTDFNNLSLINSYPNTYLELVTLLKKYHFAVPDYQLISSAQELKNIKNLSWPVVAKTTNLRLLHKAKIGAVIGDIANETEASLAYEKIKTWGQQVVFQQKIKQGIEVLCGVHKDPFWGWYLAIGMGGSLSDTYDDRAYTFLPATRIEFEQSLNRTKLVSLLNPPVKKKLVEAMLELQNCALSTTELVELEINPLFVGENTLIAADLKRA